MDHAARPAPAERRIHYERRRPEETVLYQLVQEHLETFVAQVEAETGAGLPEFVKAEFEAFLECGILASPRLSPPTLRRLWRVPVRQWVLSFPIPLRVLFAAHPEVLTPVLQIVHRGATPRNARHRATLR